MKKTPTKAPRAAFGTLLGVGPGSVEVYSSDYDTADKTKLPTRKDYRSTVDNIFMGYKWQCVELARRWLYVNKGYIFDDVAMAYDIFRLKHVRRVEDGTLLPLHSFKNGSKRPPEVGALLIWDEGGEFHVTGHVAVITEIVDNHVRFIEQNVEDTVWGPGQNFSRELQINRTSDGGYCLNCSFDDATILGWVIQTKDGTDAEEIIATDKKLFNLKLKELPNAASKRDDIWLDTKQPDLAAYVTMMGGHKLSSKDDDIGKYFCLSQSAYNELKRATSELHAMFMHATNLVLQDDSLLEKFNLPPVLWPRLHQSWDNRGNEIISGRLDFCVSEKGIKLYEYNADSASCHMETAKIQDLWASHFGCVDGICAGVELHEKLVNAWENSTVGDNILHIMQDRDLEETYHAQWMRTALDKAGIESKVIKGLSSLTWGPDGEVVDADGTPIKWVWKTWAWETALDEIRDHCATQEERLRLNQSIDKSVSPPRLADVLFTKDVMVYEPLWTLIPSNKAILPIMWSLYPNHPYLLESQFTLTDTLRTKGYVSKPIVGRCGANISIFDKNEKLLSETDGKFDDRDQIYQELWKLPKLGDYNVQVGAFTAGGRFGGACVRVDPSLIVTSKSDILALRVCEDGEF